MSQPSWSDVDQFIAGRLLPADPVLDAILSANAAAGLPAIDVSPTQGKLLHLIARMIAARHILEIGTLGGYSTVWLARALPANGTIVTLEASPRHAEVARANIARAGLADRVDLRIGPALDTLPAIETEASAPFDLIFIDADKINSPSYLAWALRLSRPGTVIIADNVIRQGAVLEPDSHDPAVQGVRALYDMLATEHHLDATALQTVGAKGWDGLVIALVK